MSGSHPTKVAADTPASVGAAVDWPGLLAIYARLNGAEGAPLGLETARAWVRRGEELGALAGAEFGGWLTAASNAPATATVKWVLAELNQMARRPEPAYRLWGEVVEYAESAAKAEALLARARLARDLGRPEDALALLRRAARLGSDFNFLTRAARFGERLAGVLPKKSLRPITIAVLSTSTTDLMVPLLKLACLRDGLRADVQVAPFGNVRQEILNPASPLWTKAPDFVLLGLHWRDAHLPELADDPEREVARVVG